MYCALHVTTVLLARVVQATTLVDSIIEFPLGLVPSSRAHITFGRGVSPTALEGLAQHSHIWVVFIFHKNNNNDKVKKARTHPTGGFTFPAKIKPPRAPTKVGTLSTRTPHRPNPIGLSVAKLESVDFKLRRLVLSGTGSRPEEKNTSNCHTTFVSLSRDSYAGYS